MRGGSIKWIIEDSERKNVFWPSEEMRRKAWVSDEKIYKEAAEDPVAWWAKLAKEGITWFKEWDETFVHESPFYKWFVGGKLNICYNAVDRHIETWRRNKVAVIWEPEPPEEQHRALTYYNLYREVNKFANVLKRLGVKKGDRVGIYMPMIPETIIAMLACARIGAVHSVVFSAFSGQSLRDRMLDAEAKLLITANGYYRRGSIINLKANADVGVEGTTIEKVVVVKRLDLNVNMVEGRDYWWHELMKEAEPYCEPEALDSEDIHFILYTSGTTGKPKGIEHHVGGYAVQAYWTAKLAFDLHDDDLFFCTADIGWITGHTYNCYGPLLNGATFLIYEGAPDYPAPDRWWQIVEEHGVTVFYTAPTAIRMLMKYGDEWVKKHDLSTLRILGTVGEPINEDAWLWYFNVVGGGRCLIIDTWWQTETGGTLIHSLPGIGPFIPTVAGRPFPGVRFAVLSEDGKPLSPGENGYLVHLPPFAPGMLRTIYKDPERFRQQYFSVYGDRVFYTGDGAYIYDEMGNIRITGRVDDVMKVAGHRIANAEVENAIAQHPAVVECAVVPAPHEVKGETPIAFVILKPGYKPSSDLEAEIKKTVDKIIGPIARPEKVFFVDDLPKTRSGKIMRRILRALLRKEPPGDVTTLMNPESVQMLKEKIEYRR